jgi:hypothetical protein
MLEDVLVGLLVIVIGAGVCFLGLRLWFILLPVWGFVAGFFIGASAVTGLFGDGFLSTVSSWVVGFIVAIGLAVLSYLLWYVGVIIAAGSVGALIGSGFMQAIGVDSGWATFIVAAIVAAVFVVGAFLLALPIYIVVVESALAGAVAVVTGVMLVFNRIDVEDLQRGPAWSFIQDSWFWVLAWAVIAGAGIYYQLMDISRTQLPTERWIRAEPTYV